MVAFTLKRYRRVGHRTASIWELFDEQPFEAADYYDAKMAAKELVGQVNVRMEYAVLLNGRGKVIWKSPQ